MYCKSNRKYFKIYSMHIFRGASSLRLLPSHKSNREMLPLINPLEKIQ